MRHLSVHSFTQNFKPSIISLFLLEFFGISGMKRSQKVAKVLNGILRLRETDTNTNVKSRAFLSPSNPLTDLL